MEVLHTMKFSDANGQGANDLSNADSGFVGDSQLLLRPAQHNTGQD